MTGKKRAVDPDRREGGEELGGMKGRETLSGYIM